MQSRYSNSVEAAEAHAAAKIFKYDWQLRREMSYLCELALHSGIYRLPVWILSHFLTLIGGLMLR